MDAATLMESMRYPGGLDYYPVVTQVLMVLTWAFHMFFINLLIGGLGLAMYGFLKKDKNWNKASKSLTKIAKVSFSLGIVFGVAPLLFTQTIYDPQWYTSNNLSASWVMSFIPILIVSYYMLYIFYFKNKEGAKKSIIVFPIISMLLAMGAGAIMHVLSYQGLFPDKWVEWYTSNGETMNSSGWNIYAFNFPRYIFFMLLSFAVTGFFMILYSWYFRTRKDLDAGYLKWFAEQGYKIAMIFGLITFADGILYLAIDGLLGHPVVVISLSVLLVALGVLYLTKKDLVNNGWLSFSFGSLAILGVAIMREAIRATTVGQFGYNIGDYKVVMDILGPAIFVGTLLVGIALFLFMMHTAYKAGKTEGVYNGQENETTKKYWSFAFYIFVFYIIIFIGTGLIIIGKNYI